MCAVPLLLRYKQVRTRQDRVGVLRRVAGASLQSPTYKTRRARCAGVLDTKVAAR